MIEIQGRLIKRIKRTPTIESLRFSLKQNLDFLPGQFLEVIFDEQNRNNRSLNKFLSFSSSPTKDYIEVTKRMSESEFSRRLLALKEEDSVLFKTPMGRCVFKEEHTKIGFLIGGIGITSVISILEYIVDKGLSTDVCLLYSNRTEDDVAFKKELDSWSESNKNIKVVYTIVDCEPKDKRCFFGMINRDFLTTHMNDYNQRIFFIFGPPKMVEAMRSLCFDVGVSQGRVKAENFVGY